MPTGPNDPPQANKRVLALDVGNRRIGLAVSDPLGITAQPLPTLLRKSKRADMNALRELVAENGVQEIVIGLPLRMGGEDSAQTERVRKFAEELGSTLHLPIHFLDERLTSWEAHQMLDASKFDRLQRKGKVDQIAAVLILQAYLQKHTGPPLLPPDAPAE